MDDALPGFGVRVYESGRKAFVLRYRTTDGQRRLLTLGSYGALTVQAARDLAQRRMGQILEGGDPLAERQDRKQGMTFADFAGVYLNQHAKPHKKSWREDERRLRTHVMPRWKNRRIDSITRGEVATLHANIGTTHKPEANRVLALVSVMFSKAIEWGYLPEAVSNPAARVRQHAERSRDRFVAPKELPRLWDAIEAEPNAYYRAAFKLYLLTGCRRSELLTLRWSDVDLEQGTAYLRETKANRPHTVPLPKLAVQLLAELPRIADNPFVFPGQGPSAHLSDLKKPWRRIRERAAMTDLRLHDLRRTFGSYLALQGAPVRLIQHALNHADIGTTQIYMHLTEEPIRAALEQHADNLVSLADWRKKSA